VQEFMRSYEDATSRPHAYISLWRHACASLYAPSYINYLRPTPPHSTSFYANDNAPPPHATTKIRPDRPVYYYCFK
jgi:hypothetical protein